MSRKLQSSHHEHDIDFDSPVTKHLQDEEDENVADKHRQNDGKNQIEEAPIKQLKAPETKSTSGLIGMIDTYDRPVSTITEGGFAKQGSYASGFEDKPGKRIPKAGYKAEAGYGRARFEASVFEAEAKGPNASAGAEASATGVGAMARAEIGSVSARAGPLGVKLGLGVDTGASAGPDGVEVKFLGTGFSIGPRTRISVLGSEVECSIM